MKLIVDCPTCSGKGKVPLPEALQETLDVLPKKGQFTAEEILERIPSNITVSAVSNRLKDLMGLGLLSRVRSSKFWKYSRV